MFLVAVHIATAVAPVIFFRRDWYIIIGLFTSIPDRRITSRLDANHPPLGIGP